MVLSVLLPRWIISRWFNYLPLPILIYGCSPDSAFQLGNAQHSDERDSNRSKDTWDHATDSSGGIPAGWQPDGTNIPSDKPVDVFMCTRAEQILSRSEGNDFSYLLAKICEPEAGGFSASMRRFLANAYDGRNQPKVTVIEQESNAMYVTRVMIGYAFTAPLDSPSKFYALKTHDLLAAGIENNNNRVLGRVEAREQFPGKGSVERVTINYQLELSEGGALFDQRKTVFNTFLLTEASNDITFSTEELLDPEQNEYYHSYTGISFAYKTIDGQTMLMFLTELIIKNRIDPGRLVRTLVSLNDGMQVKFRDFFVQSVK